MAFDTAKFFEAVLNDALAGLAIAASIFVKNPQHQQVAGAAVSGLSQLVQLIDSQINAATQASAPAPTTTTPPAS